MRGVQSVPMERPAHTALLQSIWNHPAEENSQNVNLGSCGGEGGGSFCGLPLPLLVAAIIRAPANYRVVHLVIFIIISLMTEPIMLRPFFLTFVMSGGIYIIDKFRWKIY